MKELNDKDFDQLFKTRITTETPEFEEESWAKMEKKLRKRDLLLFYRNASIILLMLSVGLGFYFTDKIIIEKGEAVIVKKSSSIKAIKPIERASVQTVESQSKKINTANSSTISKRLWSDTAAHTGQQAAQLSRHINELQQAEGLRLNASTISDLVLGIRGVHTQIVKIVAKPADEIKMETKTNLSTRRKVPISLAFALAPDFNSTTHVIGGKVNVAFGLGIGIGLTKKLSLQTGINYGHKNYSAGADNYTFKNPNTKYTIAEIKAACKVLEIPLRASLNISEHQKRSLELNAGLSSYVMLKESYLYKYTAASGRADRLIEATNENKHLLSVIDLSASYNIRFKNKKLALGIEPYIKIPLTGIGVGNVPLKSSGIALKLRYDFNKN